MGSVMLIAWTNVKRFVRNRSFYVVAFIAPLAIMAALSSTVGSALSGEFRPSLVIADEIGGGALNGLVDDLRKAGFDDLEVTNSEHQARSLVEDGDAPAAIIYPATLGQPPADAASEPEPIVVIAYADAAVSAQVAEAIAQQSAVVFDTVTVLSAVGAPVDNLAGPLEVVDEQAVGSRVLTDGTYFAVGMSSYFAFVAASGFVATLHRERREATLARMLVTPIGRFAPLIGKGLAAGAASMISYIALVISSTLFLGADWGRLLGTAAVGMALCFSAVGVSMAVVAVTRTEESATQTGTVLATAWAIFGGVFLEIPTDGPLAVASQLSPFMWVRDAIGLNAGTGTLVEVLTRTAAIMVFGLVGIAVAFARRSELGNI